MISSIFLLKLLQLNCSKFKRASFDVEIPLLVLRVTRLVFVWFRLCFFMVLVKQRLVVLKLMLYFMLYG